MGLVLLLIVAVLFVPQFYQKKYFAEYNTITKGKAFAGCTSLLYVTIPASAKDGVSENVFPNYTEIEYK
jgi:hypothetical protein